jgi:deazaflavin-dependent oxidoreductase (nitroreductase family)
MALRAAVRPLVVRYVNPVLVRVTGWLPGFCVATHRGRNSGRVYHTPLAVFRHGDRRVFALTYGPDVHWVKNVLAAGRCEIVTRGRRVVFDRPRLEVDKRATAMPIPVRWFLRLMRVDHFLWMDEVQAGPGDVA